MIKRILFLVCLIVILTINSCKSNSDEVIKLAEELEVDPHTLDTYGPGPFPLNYFLQQLHIASNVSQSEQKLTRAKVQEIVRGFEIQKECQYTGYFSDGDYSILYLYYSQDFSSALKIVAVYQMQEIELSHNDNDILLELFYLDSPTQTELLEWQKCVD